MPLAPLALAPRRPLAWPLPLVALALWLLPSHPVAPSVPAVAAARAPAAAITPAVVPAPPGAVEAKVIEGIEIEESYSVGCIGLLPSPARRRHAGRQRHHRE